VVPRHCHGTYRVHRERRADGRRRVAGARASSWLYGPHHLVLVSPDRHMDERGHRSGGRFRGAVVDLMPTINQSFPPPGGATNPLVTGLLLVCGVAIVISLVLTLVGLARSPRVAPGTAHALDAS
jgi:hypothetical protein